MKSLFLSLTVLSLVTFLSITTKAQGVQKDTTINFMGEQRNISIYIPSDYSSSIPAKLMIGLHGLGDNCKNYMNALVFLFDESSMPNTIIICPDGGNDSNKDFYSPQGDEAIIDTVISLANSQYNIDASQIILQGFSLGGRSALKFGLDYTEKFKALLLNTPAIQGVKEAVTEGNFQYANASKIPIYITCGDEDLTYLAPVDSMRLQLIRNNGKVLYRQFPLGHSVPYMSEMNDYLQFIDSLYISDYDLDIVQIDIPLRTCETSVPFTVLVQNKGSKILTSIKFSYNTGGGASYYSWTGQLEPFQHLDIEFPNLDISSGIYILTVEVDSLNVTFGDTVDYNNSANAAFNVATQSKTLPYVESFTNIADFEDDWIPIPSGDYFTALDYDPSGKFLYAFNTIWIFETMGRKEEIISPLLDLSSISNPSLAFDVAYAYTLYTADFIGTELIFADTLEVLISTDCGETYKSLYKKGGEELLTFNKPLTNVVDLNVFFYTSPTSNDWRREWVDLSAYASNTSAIIKFSYISAQGGLIFLDNIAFSNETSGIKGIEMGEIVVFPNPANDNLTIHSGDCQLKSINLFDISGKKVMSSENINGSSSILNVTGISNGFYMLELTTSSGKRIVKKVSIKH